MLERIVTPAEPFRAIGELEMRLHAITRRVDLMPFLNGADFLEPFGVVMSLDLDFLTPQDRGRLVLLSERHQGLSLNEAGVGPERVIEGFEGARQRLQGLLRLALQIKDASLLQRHFAINAALPALEQIVDVGAQPFGDHSKDTDGRSGLAHFNLIEEGPREIFASDAGEAHSPLVPDPADPLSQGLSFWH